MSLVTTGVHSSAILGMVPNEKIAQLCPFAVYFLYGLKNSKSDFFNGVSPSWIALTILEIQGEIYKRFFNSTIGFVN